MVGLCLPRGPEMGTAIVAAWLAGAAYLPLDPGYPAERLAFMLADSAATVVVTRGREADSQHTVFGNGGTVFTRPALR